MRRVYGSLKLGFGLGTFAIVCLASHCRVAGPIHRPR